MAKKPTYAELEQWVKGLEKEVIKRVQAEDALKESEARFQLLYERTPLGYQSLDEDGNFIEVNPAWLNILGYSREEVIGKNFSELLHSEWKDHFKENFPRFKAVGEILGVEFEMVKKDGSSILVSFTGKIGKDKHGCFQQTHCILQDITDRKQWEEKLLNSETQYRLLAENVRDVIWVRDMDLKMKYVSPSVEKVRGYTPEEAMTQTIEEVLTPESEKTAVDFFSRMLQLKDDERPEEYLVELEHYCKNGQTIWLEIKNSWMHDSNGERSGILGVSRDITERKQLEEQLRQSYKMEAIGTLTGGVAHDFNNILSVIIGNTELALDDVPESNPAHFSLQDIKTASLRAADVVKQLLRFSRKTDNALKPIEVIKVIRDSLKFLRSTIPVNIKIQQDMPTKEITVLADPIQISQIIMNLFINAFQELDETGGVIEIAVENVALDEEAANRYTDITKGDYVQLTISDTGPGIDPKIINRIFDPYFTTKEIGKGSGMGLSVVHGIVKNYRGSITVDSEPGKGTMFKILLPVTTEKPVIETVKKGDFPIGTETILFVDDEESIVNLIKSILERIGYMVESRTNPVEALEQFQLKPHKFDLVITDMAMPQMTGVKLSEKLRNVRPDIPIIICTGHSDLIDEEKAKELGIDAYVMKPIAKQVFVQAIRMVLDK